LNLLISSTLHQMPLLGMVNALGTNSTRLSNFSQNKSGYFSEHRSSWKIFSFLNLTAKAWIAEKNLRSEEAHWK
jgi:hypothetical protein